MILLEDINSSYRNKIRYGNKGDEVRLIADHGNVLIVEGNKGRFPVKKNKVGYGENKNIQSSERGASEEGTQKNDNILSKRPEIYLENIIRKNIKEKVVVQPSLFD